MSALAALAPGEGRCEVCGATGDTRLYRRIGELTRMLHDALRELGYDKSLERVVHALPDARQRLAYVAEATGRAAERVIGAVERARSVQQAFGAEVQGLAGRWNACPGAPDPELIAATRQFFAHVPERCARMGEELTEILLAQDFHDLTGQVIQKITRLAHAMEEQLVQLLVEAAPAELRRPLPAEPFEGPVCDATGRSDVVTSQKQVDELLESLGF